jgi:hypothetical protein
MAGHDSKNWSLIRDLLADGSNAAYITYAVFLDAMYFNSKLKNNTADFTVLNEKIMTSYQGFLFKPHEHIFKGYNRKIVQMFEGGISQYIVTQEWKAKYEKVEPPEGPVVLTLDHIDVWFHIWAVSLGFALSFLICEFIAAKLLKYLNAYLTSILVPDNRLYLKPTRPSTKPKVKILNKQKRPQKKSMVKPKISSKREFLV